jgi:8-oxo-dGTP diphosphatase
VKTAGISNPQALHNCLHVSVGVVKNPSGQLLISLRNESLHQGGLWEFPGGKVEAFETIEQALIRELKEEMDIVVQAAVPLITINHQYPDLAVQLSVFTVEHYEGEVKSCEGQPILWVSPNDLVNYSFPAANQPIITAARLPHFYAILDDADPMQLMVSLNTLLNKGITLIQARLKTLSVEAVEAFLKQAHPLCKAHKAWLMLNSSVTNADSFEVDGLHLTSAHLMACDHHPKTKHWLAASCHNLEELQHAQKIGVDFVVIAPVLPTPTHPDAKVLGWDQFAELTANINLPVYALGGMSKSDLSIVQQLGGHGIAAIRAFLG